MTNAIEQQRYQVRFDWGVAGAAAVGADADLIIWVDALGETMPVPAVLPAGCAVVVASLPHAADAAAYLVDLQHRLGRRAMVALIGAGEQTDDRMRFAVEDLLAAGALVDALGSLGIDATSPEAAAAEAAYSGLRGAVGHLLTASVSASAGIPLPEAAELVELRAHPTL